MIRGLVFILLFQGMGEIISKALSLPIPGPVIGMVLLLSVLVIRDQLDPDVERVAGAFTQNLGLLFIPAAVGVVMFIPALRVYGLSVAAILLASVALSIAITAITLRLLTPPASTDDAAPSPESEE
ncbi:MAG: CidA/LrgA family protein [Burkholderiaceae bacterium]|nr:CidA/LrgA family protein [Burkholderiaceae bacterium]